MVEQVTAEFSEEKNHKPGQQEAPYTHTHTHTQGVCQTHTSGMEMGVLPCVKQQIPFSSLLSSKETPREQPDHGRVGTYVTSVFPPF